MAGGYKEFWEAEAEALEAQKQKDCDEFNKSIDEVLSKLPSSLKHRNKVVEKLLEAKFWGNEK